MLVFKSKFTFCTFL